MASPLFGDDMTDREIRQRLDAILDKPYLTKEDYIECEHLISEWENNDKDKSACRPNQG